MSSLKTWWQKRGAARQARKEEARRESEEEINQRKRNIANVVRHLTNNFGITFHLGEDSALYTHSDDYKRATFYGAKGDQIYEINVYEKGAFDIKKV